MKKLLLLLLLFLFLPSCNKVEKEEPKFCWDCILTQYYRAQISPGIYGDWIGTPSNVEYCDKTEEEITLEIHYCETKGGNYTAYKLECIKRMR